MLLPEKRVSVIMHLVLCNLHIDEIKQPSFLRVLHAVHEDVGVNVCGLRTTSSAAIVLQLVNYRIVVGIGRVANSVGTVSHEIRHSETGNMKEFRIEITYLYRLALQARLLWPFIISGYGFKRAFEQSF